MTGQRARFFQTLAGLAIGGLFLTLVVRGIDPQKLWHSLRGVDPGLLALSAAAILMLLAASYVLKALRWRWLLQPVVALPLSSVLPPLLIGFMANNLLPAHLGEFVRMVVLARQERTSRTAVLSTIVLERVLDFIVIIGLFAAAAFFLPSSAGTQDGAEALLRSIRIASGVIGIAAVALLVMFLVFVWQTEPVLRLAAGILRPAPHALRARVLDMLSIGGQGLYSLRDPRLALGIAAATLAHWTLNACILYLAIVAFPLAAPLPLSAGFFLMGVCAMAVALPSAPAYIGTFQFCFMLSLDLYGVPPETALAASVYSLAAGFLPVTAAGLFCLHRQGLKLRLLRNEAAHMNADTAPENVPRNV